MRFLPAANVPGSTNVAPALVLAVPVGRMAHAPVVGIATWVVVGLGMGTVVFAAWQH